MLRGLVSILAMTARTGCSIFNCRPSDPAGHGEWVCETPRTGETGRQTRNPVYGNN